MLIMMVSLITWYLDINIDCPQKGMSSPLDTYWPPTGVLPVRDLLPTKEVVVIVEAFC